MNILSNVVTGTENTSNITAVTLTMILLIIIIIIIKLKLMYGKPN